MSKPRLILASKSASRRQLLENAGVAFTAETSHVDEDAIKKEYRMAKKTVDETALALARAKADRVAATHADALVLGADQMLECDGHWFDKANSIDEAKEQLKFLRGKTHRLITAAVLLRGERLRWKSVIEARMTMRGLSDRFIDDYCARLGQDLLGTVGCYALEGLGSQLFERIDGDFFGILGLPLLPLLQALRAEGILEA